MASSHSRSDGESAGMEAHLVPIFTECSTMLTT